MRKHEDFSQLKRISRLGLSSARFPPEKRLINSSSQRRRVLLARTKDHARSSSNQAPHATPFPVNYPAQAPKPAVAKTLRPRRIQNSISTLSSCLAFSKVYSACAARLALYQRANPGPEYSRSQNRSPFKVDGLGPVRVVLLLLSFAVVGAVSVELFEM